MKISKKDIEKMDRIRWLNLLNSLSGYKLAKFDETESEFIKCELTEDGHVDLDRLDTVCISGLNHYHQVHQITTYGYARPGEFPLNSFSKA